MHIAGTNLNDLVVLHALVSTGSVTLAAARVGLSPSATSHALARLRRTLDDPLFVRERGSLVATPACAAMAARLDRAMADIESLLGARASFDAAISTRTFRIASSDVLLALGFDRVLEGIRAEAPRVGIVLAPRAAGDRERLAEGRIDAIVGGPLEGGAGAVASRALFDEPFVVVARRAHPAIVGRLGVAGYAACAHVVVSSDEKPTFVDRALRAAGYTRDVAVRVPDFGVVASLLEHTDLVATVPTSVARWYGTRFAVRARRVPLPLPRFRASVHVQARHAQDPALTWLCARLEAAAGLRGEGRRRSRA